MVNCMDKIKIKEKKIPHFKMSKQMLQKRGDKYKKLLLKFFNKGLSIWKWWPMSSVGDFGQ